MLRAYAYWCAMCGFDGRPGRNPVAIEAAHVRWHSQDGPDDLANAVTLRSLHHALVDCGVLGLSPGLQIAVSPPHGATSLQAAPSTRSRPAATAPPARLLVPLQLRLTDGYV